VLNTTARLLIVLGGIALGLMAVTNLLGLRDASESVVGESLSLAAESSAGLTAEQKRRQAADLLARAREAINAGDLEAAEALISQAEALKVSYGMLSLEDTPAKARKALEQKRKSNTESAARPSQLFSPAGGARHSGVPASDPFARREASQSTGNSILDQARATPLPAVDNQPEVPGMPRNDVGRSPLGRATAYSPAAESHSGLPAAFSHGGSGPQPNNNFANMPGVPGGAADNLAGAPGVGSSGLELLRAARKALAVGDLRRAQTLVQQARAQQAQFDPAGDTPDRVEALIRRHQDVMAMPNNTEGYRRAYAKLLVEQAYGLLRSGDLAEAEELANQAARQGVTYSPFEQTPQDLLRQIAAARRQLGPAAYAAAPQGQLASQEGDGGMRRPVGDDGSRAANMPIGSVTPELRQEALELVRKAREALAAGQYQWAEDLAKRAARMRLPDEVFGPPENQPGQLLYEIRLARSRQSEVLPASASYPVTHAGGEGPADQSAQRAFYQPHTDGTRNVRAGHEVAVRPEGYYHLAQVPTPAPPRPDAGGEPRPPAQPRETVGMSLFRQGEEALRAHDKDRAYQFFRQAANYMHELDPESQQRLRERLTLLAPPAARPAEQPGRPATEEAAMALSAQARQAYQDVLAQESKAKALRASDPKGALKLLEETRTRIEGAGLDTATRNRLLAHLDRAIAETKQFIEHNRPHIDLEERNRQIRDEIDRQQRLKVEIEAKYALLVNEFNRLMDEQRFEEAEVVAKRAAELDPQNPVSQQLLWQSKFVRRFMNNEAVKAAKEDMFVRALGRVEEAAVAFDDMRPYQHGDVRQWEELTRSRARFAARRGRPRSEREMEIERKLRTPVSLQFQNASLGRVLDYLAKVADVNLYLDPQGLAQEGVTTDTPVTIDLRQEITLKSALNLILEPLHLKYTIKNEVLKITSEQMRDSDLYRVTYNVADLVVPIPHFVPSPRMGLAGAVHDALGSFGYGGGAGGFGSLNTPLAVVASKDGSKGSAAINPAVLAQVAGPSMASGAIPAHSGPIGFGPGGLGGGAQADFDSLIDLITTTVRPDTWDAGGGAGTIAPFETNLSIVVSQTQEVHEEIVDLLEQLRRLQDLQVTIEVRFITLNDNFFERIGIDFDFNVDDNIDGKPGQPFGRIVGPPPFIGAPPVRDFQNVDHGKNVTVGLSPQLTTGMNPDLPSVFAADLDIPFRQNSFGLAVPQFGGYQAGAGATLGFAILSDIEAFFFIEAAQGDRRTNVLQAPKVTLFNGQQAFVSDTSQTPFVISVIPVVGDFAAAQQPVIVVLSEGTFMTVQAVVSDDRRFVRLTLVPFFSRIGDVQTFTFTGSETTTTDTSAEGWVNPLDLADPRRTSNSNKSTTTRSGTTVQLPTFSFVTVTTTVSVPDGGTVLLGGIKRLREGRSEFGVPILNKLPYLNRLFKNVGHGREAQSLMMTVTPRIIIQEEEEEKLGIATP